MRIQTLSVLVGNRACNAKCPFCVSRMTPNGDNMKPNDVNWTNLDVACDLARAAGATTAMITGKGEPTLWPELVTEHLKRISGKIPLLELQTNGIRIAQGGSMDDHLKDWREQRLTTIAISVASMLATKNYDVYGYAHSAKDGVRKHFEIPDVVEKLHGIGFSVRLSVVLVGGLIDFPDRVKHAVASAKKWGVEQLTLMPMTAPVKSESDETSKWVEDHRLRADSVEAIHDFLKENGDSLMQLPHGAEIFDVGGQNACLNNCLRPKTIDNGQIRNLIFHPDGHLRSDWTHEGSIIL